MTLKVTDNQYGRVGYPSDSRALRCLWHTLLQSLMPYNHNFITRGKK